MGRVKEWIIEQEMLEQHGARIAFNCPNEDCGSWIEHYNEIPCPNFQAEKQSDITQTDFIEIVCESCGLTINGSITNDSAFVTAELDDYPELDIEVDAPDQFDDPYDDYFPPSDPYSIAKEALGHLNSMIGTPSPANDLQFTNRLVFSGAISLFEAYLGDTLINAVRNHPDTRDTLLKNNSVFGDLKVSAADLANDPDIVTKHVVRDLKAILFHNLKVVTALYKDALSITLIPAKETRDALFQAVALRHDCVHRNGQDKDGKKLDVFSDQFVRDVLAAIDRVIDHIETETIERLPF